ncbi:MAG: metallophosphoesterase [Clostridia bacterium]|nr:metallophosphoesterase [Clostridia bacterium]
MVFFTADTHFGDDAIRRYENRPFSDVNEMDEALITRWNSVVAPEDTVFHLGDFCCNGTDAALLARLNGTKFLVRGNHETKPNAYYRQAGFAEVYDHPILYDGFWLLSHEPLYVCENMPYANLFGHVHASPLYRDFSPHHFCVCVERCDFKPVSFETLKKALCR